MEALPISDWKEIWMVEDNDAAKCPRRQAGEASAGQDCWGRKRGGTETSRSEKACAAGVQPDPTMVSS